LRGGGEDIDTIRSFKEDSLRRICVLLPKKKKMLVELE
jgi:hypothetical protein